MFGEADSPQTRHKPARLNSENGGFLRIAEDNFLWRKTYEYPDLFP
jgi:hypothetical protein